MTDLTSLCVSATDSIKLAIACIDANRAGIALVTDANMRLLGTDGDIRRAVLAGIELNAPVESLIAQKTQQSSSYVTPITATAGTPHTTLLSVMKDNNVVQLPIVNESGCVVDVVTLEELVSTPAATIQAVIMAGGYGHRLRPLTDDLPKPMLPVGDRPLMQHTLERLRDAGIKKVSITTHYKADKVVDYFGDGQQFGVELQYVFEEQPLGTAGSLSLLRTSDEPMLVINGDIITDVDYLAMLAYHREHRAEMTVGVRTFDLEVPYGVLECDGSHVRSIQEKPAVHLLVNAGIYLLEPNTHRHVPNAEAFDMTDLIKVLLGDNKTVVSFPVYEYWADVGHPDTYEQLRNGRKSGDFRS